MVDFVRQQVLDCVGVQFHGYDTEYCRKPAIIRKEVDSFFRQSGGYCFSRAAYFFREQTVKKPMRVQVVDFFVECWKVNFPALNIYLLWVTFEKSLQNSLFDIPIRKCVDCVFHGRIPFFSVVAGELQFYLENNRPNAKLAQAWRRSTKEGSDA